MNIFYDINEVPKKKNTIITVGTFDGVHLGHQKIINEVIYHSVDRGARSFVITFEPHPRQVLDQNFEVPLLTTLEEKIKLIRNLSIQNLLIINFTKEFSNINFRDFVKDIIVDKIGVSEIVIGFDHQFGKNREGNTKSLQDLGKEFDFKVHQIPSFIVGETVVKSSKIRHALAEGDVIKAKMYLGTEYQFTGKVVKGIMRGRDLGYPTANIELNNKFKAIPKVGVYFVEVVLGDRSFYGMMNIGYRPTFNNLRDLTIEVHLFYFDEDIYGRELTVKFIDRIRDEKKFNSVDDLVYQLKSDKQTCFDRIKNFELEAN
ncbi:MAG: bifunctional riboflavin kinase/FAD synthetase [Ignavibacteria bacterium]|nr:bifunctional riboflavin kinase/FAD synthetase [Ignavibacteria bacterium]